MNFKISGIRIPGHGSADVNLYLLFSLYEGGEREDM